MQLESLKNGKFEAKTISQSMQKIIAGGGWVEKTLQPGWDGRPDTNTYSCCEGLYDKLDSITGRTFGQATLWPGTRPEDY